MSDEIDEIEVIDLEEYAGSNHPIPKHVHYYKIRIDDEKILVKSPIKAEEILIATDLEPEDYQLVQVFKGGREVELDPNQEIDLRADGVERFKALLMQSMIITVNARPKTVTEKRLSFMEVVALAFNPVPTGDNWVFTVTYYNGPKKNPEGSMVKGDKVKIKKGMVFNVTATDKS
jgi:hypothetical protein